MIIRNSTFYDNHAQNGNGGAIFMFAAQTQIEHSTFISNTATNEGNAIYAFSGSAKVRNSLLGDNTGAAPTTCGGNVTTVATLVEDGSCNAQFSGDPQLAALGDYGGSTQTFALLPGSPAIMPVTPQRAWRPISAASLARRAAAVTSARSSLRALRSPTSVARRRAPWSTRPSQHPTSYRSPAMIRGWSQAQALC